MLCQKNEFVAEIKAKQTRDEMVEYFLDKISLRPDSAFDALVKAMEETSQSHIASVLTGRADRKMFLFQGKL